MRPFSRHSSILLASSHQPSTPAPLTPPPCLSKPETRRTTPPAIPAGRRRKASKRLAEVRAMLFVGAKGGGFGREGVGFRRQGRRGIGWIK